LVNGIVMLMVVSSVELSNDAEIIIPEFSSKPSAVTGFEKGTIAKRRIVVNRSAQRISGEDSARSKGLCQSKKPMSSRVLRASSKSGASPSVISEI
jgi:hypothetical protein